MNNPNLTIGTYGSNVSNLQRALSNQGFLPPASEINQAFFGPGTRRAVMAFQASKKLPQTGQVDAQTAALLGAGAKLPTTAPVPPTTARTAKTQTPVTITGTTGKPAPAPVVLAESRVAPTPAKPTTPAERPVNPPTLSPMAALTNSIAAPPIINLSLVQAILAVNPNLNPTQPLPANANLSGISAANQAAARTSWEALRKEINTFPAFNYTTLLSKSATVSSKNTQTTLANPIRDGVLTFLKNSSAFNFQTTNINAFLTSNPNALNGIPNEYQAAVTDQLKAYQRTYRVTSDSATITNLMGEGFDWLDPLRAFRRKFSCSDTPVYSVVRRKPKQSTARRSLLPPKPSTCT